MHRRSWRATVGGSLRPPRLHRTAPHRAFLYCEACVCGEASAQHPVHRFACLRLWGVTGCARARLWASACKCECPRVCARACARVCVHMRVHGKGLCVLGRGGGGDATGEPKQVGRRLGATELVEKLVREHLMVPGQCRAEKQACGAYHLECHRPGPRWGSARVHARVCGCAWGPIDWCDLAPRACAAVSRRDGFHRNSKSRSASKKRPYVTFLCSGMRNDSGRPTNAAHACSGGEPCVRARARAAATSDRRAQSKARVGQSTLCLSILTVNTTDHGFLARYLAGVGIASMS